MFCGEVFLRAARVSLTKACDVCDTRVCRKIGYISGVMIYSGFTKGKTHLSRQALPLLRAQVFKPEGLVHACVVPLAVLVVEAFCGGYALMWRSQIWSTLTSWHIKLGCEVNGGPPMSRADPRIGAT